MWADNRAGPAWTAEDRRGREPGGKTVRRTLGIRASSGLKAPYPPLPVDVGGKSVSGDATEPADMNGLDLPISEQLVEQASSDTEPLGGLGDRQKQALPSAVVDE
jgi:hypothetical protein